MLTLVTGRKLPRSTRMAFLRSTSDGCSTSPAGPEDGGPAQAELHQLQAHHAIVNVAEFNAGKLDHVDLEALGRKVVQQRFQHQVRLVMQKEGGVKQIDSDDPQGLLLQAVLMIEHANVDDDLAVLIAGVGLELDAHPAVALIGALKVAGGDGIGEGEEGGAVSARRAQAFQVQTGARSRACSAAARATRSACSGRRWRR